MKGGREETSLSLSLASPIYHNFTPTYCHSSDDFFTLNGSNGVISYLAVLSGPAVCVTIVVPKSVFFFLHIYGSVVSTDAHTPMHTT